MLAELKVKTRLLMFRGGAGEISNSTTTKAIVKVQSRNTKKQLTLLAQTHPYPLQK